MPTQAALPWQGSAAIGGWAMGDERFRRRIARAAERRATPLPKGRKAGNAKKDKRQMDLL
ncbi:MAG: hypothetical protein SGJ03_03490 [Alphaproteobacteria bacterium]|nr:hypothetical protein [Alphaproteobacteria bacterium]